LHQQVNSLDFCHEQYDQVIRPEAESILAAAHDQTERLFQSYLDLKKKIEAIIARASQRYDAVNHQWPEGDLPITPEQKKLVDDAASWVNTLRETHPFYPEESAREQKYLEGWVQEQYVKIRSKLQEGRSLINQWRPELLESEKKVLRYFLAGVANSQIDFIREKAVVLRKELDPETLARRF
jgi:hypothetical protein